MPDREIHIPLSIQLEAICLPKLQQTWLFLMPYLPDLGALNPRKDSEEIIRQAVKDHLAFSDKDLIVHLQNHPDACSAMLQDSKDKPASAVAFIEEIGAGKYRVSRAGEANPEIRVFSAFPEAAADYVLLSWGLPRLTKEEATWEDGA